MTQPSSFNDYSTALRMREVVEKLVREGMNKQRPPARYGKVVSFNRFTMSARILFPGDVETTSVKFPVYLQPTRSIDTSGEQSADVVRVEGVPGNLWITDIVNGPAQQERTRLSNPRLMGGVFMHTQVSSFFSAGTSDLPGQNETWYIGLWTNESSFASDGLATLDVVVQQTLFCSITKHYSLCIRSDDTGGAWKKVAPTQDSGPWSENDFELEIKTGSNSIEFRVRRTGWNTGGFTPGGYDFNVWFHGQEWEKDPSVSELISAGALPDRMIGTTSNEGKGPFLSPAMNIPSRAQGLLYGGGAVSYEPTFGIFKWTARFMVMGLGRNHYSPDGYFDIPVPVGGVAVPVYNKTGTTVINTSAGGVSLSSWDTLYYELPVGGYTNTMGEAGFRIVSYQSGTFQVPSHWVLIASKTADAGFDYIKCGNGEIVNHPHNLGLTAGFGVQGGGMATPAWRRVQGSRVSLEGAVSCTAAKAAGTTVANMPLHNRPGATHPFQVIASTGAVVRVDVQSSGAIILQTALALGTWFALDGIQFPAIV